VCVIVLFIDVALYPVDTCATPVFECAGSTIPGVGTMSLQSMLKETEVAARRHITAEISRLEAKFDLAKAQLPIGVTFPGKRDEEDSRAGYGDSRQPKRRRGGTAASSSDSTPSDESESALSGHISSSPAPVNLGAMPTGNSAAERAARNRSRVEAAARGERERAAKALAATRGRGGERGKGGSRGPSHSPLVARARAGAGAVAPLLSLPVVDLVPFSDIDRRCHGLAGTEQYHSGCGVSATIMLMLAGFVAKGVRLLAPSPLPPLSGSNTGVAAALHSVLSTFTLPSVRTRSSTTNTGVAYVTEKAVLLRAALGCHMTLALDVVENVLVPLLHGLHSDGCFGFDGSFVVSGVGCPITMPRRAHETILSTQTAQDLALRQQGAGLGEFISHALVNHKDVNNMCDTGCDCGIPHYVNTWWAEQPLINRATAGENTRLLFVQLTGTNDHSEAPGSTAASRVWKSGLRWEGEFVVMLPITRTGALEKNRARVIGVIYHHPMHWTACIRGHSAWHYHDDLSNHGNIVEVSSHVDFLQDPMRSCATHRAQYGWEAHVLLLALTPVV
jgi:hypothetical protein